MLNPVSLEAVTLADANRKLRVIWTEVSPMANLDKYTSPVVRKALVYSAVEQFSGTVQDRITCWLVLQPVDVSLG